MIDRKKLALGTVQFGLSYGVANQSGQVPVKEVSEILDFSLRNGINTLDTAIAYGDSESVLGAVGNNRFDVITKLPSCSEVDLIKIEEWVFDSIKASLTRLKKSAVTGVLLHRPKDLLGVKGQSLHRALEKLKQDGLTSKIGVSVYEPADLEEIIPNFQIDLVQLPLNVIDARWDDWLPKLRDMNIEVHTRSSFLQGLLLMSTKQRHSKFNRWSKLWTQWDEWLLESSQSALSVCLNGVMEKKEVSKVIVGVDSLEQLQEIVMNSNFTDSLSVPEDFKTDDPFLLNPSNWNNL